MPTKKTKGVYVIVAFTQAYLEALQVKHAAETTAHKIIQKHRRADTDYKKDPAYVKLGKDHMRNFKKHLNTFFMGPANKGFFPTQQAAVRCIQKNGHHIHEGNYYTLLLVEFRPFGYENFCWDDENLWFKGKSTGKGWCDYTYIPIKKPKYLRGTIGFSG